MSTTAWVHLPNAAHIDWVLHTQHSHPQVWYATWDAAWDAARGAAWDAAWDAAWTAARDAAWVAARDAAWTAAGGAAWGAARDAAYALIAWDDAGRWLRAHWSAAHMAADAGDHAAVLLLPAAHVAWELGYSQQMKEMV